MNSQVNTRNDLISQIYMYVNCVCFFFCSISDVEAYTFGDETIRVFYSILFW